jgi:formylglycine-generating enzyme required for sulfatase activity
VTNGAFAAWTADHPSWGQESAVDLGLADNGYLSHFIDGQPVEGDADKAVSYVSWSAANEYCRAHGGLYPLDAEPLRWAESNGAPGFEWRADRDGRPRWRDSTGETSKPGIFRASMTGTLFGFRCAG